MANKPQKPCPAPGWTLALFSVGLSPLAAAESPPAPPPLTMALVLEQSKPADWRPLDPENTLYVELSSGRVVIELSPAFAPRHVANIKALARERYYDGLPIVRSQDNYVVQWADPDGKRKIRDAQKTFPAEFTRALTPDLPFTRLPDVDGYAPEVGFSQSLPAARDPRSGRAWLAHCYGMVGAGRDNDADSGGGTELYVVNGNAPRHLDRNVTLVARLERNRTAFELAARLAGDGVLRHTRGAGADQVDPCRR